jgi:hypothetical protein
MRIVVVVAAAVVTAQSALAQSTGSTTFRCGSDLVQIGDSKVSAQQKCGAPLAKDSFCKPTPGAPAGTRPRVVPSGVCETVDEWTYNPGYGQFMTTLRFESGRLVAITYGDRVR